MPQKNIGTADRLFRLTVAVILFALSYWLGSWLLLAAALFTLYEAVASWCVYFWLTGKNSCKIK